MTPVLMVGLVTTVLTVILSQGVRVFPWKVLGPGDDNSESFNTLKVYFP